MGYHFRHRTNGSGRTIQAGSFSCARSVHKEVRSKFHLTLSCRFNSRHRDSVPVSKKDKKESVDSQALSQPAVIGERELDEPTNEDELDAPFDNSEEPSTQPVSGKKNRKNRKNRKST